jgi:glycosyltransferase involved in cell wall biosynthesis
MFRPGKKHDKVFRVVFVGNVCLRKGIGDLLHAVRPLQALRQIECWLIGSISADAKRVLDSYRDCFVYKGIIPRERLSEYYTQGTVLVLPSVEEGLALVLAQAMACGVPIIATPNTGAEDILTDGIEGFIVPVGKPDEIRLRLEALRQEPHLRESMSSAALSRVRSMEGWGSYAKSCIAMYQQVIDRKLRPE